MEKEYTIVRECTCGPMILSTNGNGRLCWTNKVERAYIVHGPRGLKELSRILRLEIAQTENAYIIPKACL